MPKASALTKYRVGKNTGVSKIFRHRRFPCVIIEIESVHIFMRIEKSPRLVRSHIWNLINFAVNRRVQTVALVVTKLSCSFIGSHELLLRFNSTELSFVSGFKGQNHKRMRRFLESKLEKFSLRVPNSKWRRLGGQSRWKP